MRRAPRACSPSQGAKGEGAGALEAKKHPIEVGEGDAFWQQNGHQDFGVVASSIDDQLKQYQEVMASLSKRNLSGGDAEGATEAEAVQEATKALLTTVKSLPRAARAEAQARRPHEPAVRAAERDQGAHARQVPRAGPEHPVRCATR